MPKHVRVEVTDAGGPGPLGQRAVQTVIAEGLERSPSQRAGGQLALGGQPGGEAAHGPLPEMRGGRLGALVDTSGYGCCRTSGRQQPAPG